jgi:predicted alpha/beta superfamily hydrolase
MDELSYKYLNFREKLKQHKLEGLEKGNISEKRIANFQNIYFQMRNYTIIYLIDGASIFNFLTLVILCKYGKVKVKS